ncbi:MAG: class I SAM-dependent DNA methyltransferase [Patescibacteria group bacterium]
MLSSTLRSKVDRLWDKFWSGGISNPLTAIEQITYLLFMKRLDELDLKRLQDAEFTGEKHKPFFKPDEKNLRWHQFKQMEGGEMLEHVQKKVFPFIKSLAGRDGPFVEYMANAVFIITKPSLLVEAVTIIDEIFEEIEREQDEGQEFQDTQGDLYEHLLSAITSAGKLGQFRTPRHIIQLICELVNPKLGDTICDPACGTGGFLLGAYQHILTQHTSAKHIKTDSNGLKRGTMGDKLTNEKQWEHLKKRTFFGYDMDETMVRIGLMNLIMHGISHPNICQRDTLSKSYNEDGMYDVIAANPPFKGSIDKGDINETLMLPTTKTELLFVNRIINSLKIGGRGGVIVPDGVLFGSSKAHKLARKMLIERCELQGVISMPSGVFRPYAGVSTAILVFVKGGETEKVWFYDMEADGYSFDDKREKVEANDLPDIVEKWNKRQEIKTSDRKSKFFWVQRKEIEEKDFDLSINRYKEVTYEAVEYEKPEVILGKIEGLEKEIMNEVSSLKSIL